MARRKEENREKCAGCKFSTWSTENEWNFSIYDSLPLTLRCSKHPEKFGINRDAFACNDFQPK